jgi:hypothetical protein
VDVNVILTPPLYSLYGESLMEYTGRCQNDFTVRGQKDKKRDAVRRPDRSVAARHHRGAAHLSCL